MTDRLICQSCDEPKLNLERTESRIAVKWKLNLCHDCIRQRFEPKWLIILAIRQYGMTDKAANYIKKNLYVGTDIVVKEILP